MPWFGSNTLLVIFSVYELEMPAVFSRYPHGGICDAALTLTVALPPFKAPMKIVFTVCVIVTYWTS